MTAGLVLGLFALMALNIPVAFAMLLAAIAYLTVLDQVPLIVVAQQAAAGTDKFLLLAIPFFFLAAELMSVGGSLQRLMDFSHALVGHIRGGLGQVNVVSSMLFAGMTGSAVADAAGPGRIEIEMMRRAGYDVGFSAAITGASATIGPIIPPSIPFVVYGSLAEVSVGKLFIAGILPGVAMGLFLMGSVWWIAGRRSFPRYRWPGWAETASRFVRALPVLVLPLVILGGIFSGVFTPTELAVVAAGYALLLGFATRELRSADLGAILLRVGADTSRIMLIVVASAVFSWILAREGVPQALAAATLALTDEPWLVLLLINVLLLLLGTVMEPLPIMVTGGAGADAPGARPGHRSGPFRRRRDAEPDDRPDHAAGWPRHVHDDGHREGVDGALRPRKPAVPGGPAAGAPSGDLRSGARPAPTAARVRPIGLSRFRSGSARLAAEPANVGAYSPMERRNCGDRRVDRVGDDAGRVPGHPPAPGAPHGPARQPLRSLAHGRHLLGHHQRHFGVGELGGLRHRGSHHGGARRDHLGRTDRHLDPVLAELHRLHL